MKSEPVSFCSKNERAKTLHKELNDYKITFKGLSLKDI